MATALASRSTVLAPKKPLNWHKQLSTNMLYGLFCLIFGVLCNKPASAQTIIRLSNNAEALLYLPQEFQPQNRYPVLIALHGLNETMQNTLAAWQQTADELQMILLCPQGSGAQNGYTRAPLDDRLIFVRFLLYLDQHYNIDVSKSFLAGFSKGGSFALETGILYPNKFPNIICLFGYYNDNPDIRAEILRQNHKKRSYHFSRFYLITGNNDTSKESLLKSVASFQANGIKTKVTVYNDLVHTYPPNLTAEIQKIQKWAY